MYIKQNTNLKISNFIRLKNNKEQKNIIHFHMVRYGLFEIAKKLKQGNILIPSYYCDAITKPFEKAGINIRFYRIKKDLKTDFNDLNKKINKETKAILFIHYFGFPNEVEKYVNICKKNNILLIEDCVQAMFSYNKNKKLGSSGDISFNSWRKFLPVLDGSSFRINDKVKINNQKKLGLYTQIKILKNTFEKTRKDNNLSLKDIKNQKESQILSIYINKKPVMISKIIFNKYNIKNSISKRRANYKYLEESLPSVFKELPEGVCPFVFPLLTKQNNMDFKLRKNGIEASQWRTKGMKGNAFFLSEHVVFLPIHEDLKKEDLDYIIDKVKDLTK